MYAPPVPPFLVNASLRRFTEEQSALAVRIWASDGAAAHMKVFAGEQC
jgi:hypothetical protein